MPIEINKNIDQSDGMTKHHLIFLSQSSCVFKSRFYCFSVVSNLNLVLQLMEINHIKLYLRLQSISGAMSVKCLYNYSRGQVYSLFGLLKQLIPGNQGYTGDQICNHGTKTEQYEPNEIKCYAKVKSQIKT